MFHRVVYIVTNGLLKAKYVLNSGVEIIAYYYKPRVKASFM
jgi:hypothetical protein